MSISFLTSPYTFMNYTNPIIQSFKGYTRPESAFPEAYERLAGIFGNYASDVSSIYKLMAKLDGELQLLKTKLLSHNSPSLQRLVASKEELMKNLAEFVEQDRTTFFSRGETVGKQVETYLGLASA